MSIVFFSYMYAIWALFEENDDKYLSKIIEDLSEVYHSSKFFPHITVYGLADIKLRIIEKVVSDSIENLKPFKVNKIGINYSDDFWKTVFIEIRPNHELKLINTRLCSKLKKYATYEFAPHISLIYKKMKSSEKMKISNMKIKNKFTIDSIAIQQFSENIAEWKIIRNFKL